MSSKRRQQQKRVKGNNDEDNEDTKNHREQRRYIFDIVNDTDLNRIVSLQRATGYHHDKPPTAPGWRVLHLYLEALSVSATGIVFILLFPLWFALGHPRVTVHLCLVMSLAQLATSVIKDLAQVPRPFYPPVIRVGGNSYKAEMSFPSGHSSGAVLLAYINARFINEIYFSSPSSSLSSSNNVLVVAVGVAYVLQVAFSRVYLGMHWPRDIVGGLLVGIVIATIHGGFGGDAFLDSLLASVNLHAGIAEFLLSVALPTLLIGMSFLIFHPTPDAACPCILDTARFIGAALGAIFGVWAHGVADGAAVTSFLPMSKHINGFGGANDIPYSPPAESWPEALALMVLYMALMVVNEIVVKSVLEKLVLPKILGKDRMMKRHWTAVYVWARFFSHVAFSFALLFQAPLLRYIVEYYFTLH